MSNKDTLSAQRLDYEIGQLTEDNMLKDPIEQFKLWLNEAMQTDIVEPNAMNLATSSKDGVLSSRVVLLKQVDERGFVFFTNYESNKGQDIEDSKQVALCFWWGSLHRQVRIQGKVEKVSAQESDEYFDSRPRGSRIGAIASKQSAVLTSYQELADRVAELEKQYADAEQVQRPKNWGGYLVVPEMIEFWQGRPSRLHDRLRYSGVAGGQWCVERLSP